VANAVDVPPVLSVVAEPIRWELLGELARSDRRVGELTRLLGRPQNLVSYHLGELRKTGIVCSRRSSADRRDVYYRADLLRFLDLLSESSSSIHPALLVARRPPVHAPKRGRQPRVLFLCTGNSARSQIAEALIEARSDHAISARSAGSHPKPLHPNAVRVMADRGIDIAGNATKPLTRFTHSRFDRVITLCDKVREVCPDFPGVPEAVHWSMGDPAAEGDTDQATLPAFERVADELEERIDLLITELAARPTEGNHHDG
jgi:protein-tyrosine-phosphatase/DNA-binding transcriptional ArsR family regulator